MTAMALVGGSNIELEDRKANAAFQVGRHEPVTFTVLAPASPATTAAAAVLARTGATPRPADPSRYDLDAAPAAIEAIVGALAELGQAFSIERHAASYRRRGEPGAPATDRFSPPPSRSTGPVRRNAEAA